MAPRVEILLVEDTPSDVRLTQEALKDCDLDYNLAVVNDGEQAMDFFRKVAGTAEQPSIVLLDLNMPKKNGHQVLEEMQQIKALKDVLVILLTVSRDEEDILKALHLKMNYYLGKPITSEKLNTLLKAIHELETKDMSAVRSHGGEDAHVRYVMAGNPHTSPAVLTKLGAEDNAHIRMRVAENAHAPVELLKELAKDADPEVRMGVAENPQAPADLLENLAKDTSEDVRLALAGNHRLPHNILKQLEEDEHPHVVAAAKKSLDMLATESK